MKDDYLLHLETTNVTVIADAGADRPGTKAKLMGANNELCIESTGSVQDDKKLSVNEVEVVTKTTLRQYVSGILNNGGIGLATLNRDTLKWVGGGIMDSPLEALVSLPAATETSNGIVKVVNEGSHGYPCPGISDRCGAGVYDTTEKCMLIFRNGADDLEKDVFLSYYWTETKKYTPTSDRFRPPSLPITAKPLNVVHSGQGTILINTTDGLFVLLTNNNVNWQTWRAVKLDFPGTFTKPPAGQSGGELWRGWYSFIIGTTLYVMRAYLGNGSCWTTVWSGTVTAANALSMTHRNVVGTNANGTVQTTGDVFYIFDKIWGSAGEKCMAYNADGYWSSIDTAHHGDDVDYVIEGNKVRVCHDGFNYASRIGEQLSHRHNVSYVIDLPITTVTFDNPGLHPMPFTRTGWAHPMHNPVGGVWGGNEEFSPIRSNGVIMGLLTDNLAMAPHMFHVHKDTALSEFENIKSGNNFYAVDNLFVANGNYGGVVKMGFGGLHGIADNTYLGKSSDGTLAEVVVDPYGSYGPTIKGYGPTNDRRVVDWNYVYERKCMVSVYDGDKMKLQGVVLHDDRLTGNSQIGLSGPELPVSLGSATFEAFKQQLVAAYATGLTVKSSRMTLMFHRVAGVPLLGALQVMHQLANGAKEVITYLFTFSADKLLGDVKALYTGTMLKATTTAGNATGLASAANAWIDSPTHNLYRLDDGAWAFTLATNYQTVIGNSWNNQCYGVYNPKVSRFVFTDVYPTYVYLRRGFFNSKEFGFGRGYQSDAGESYYFDSWGKTSAEVFATYQNNALAETLTMIMSRTDAGDNVAVSQYGTTLVRNKILSLIPPTRRVQGMDLSQDRVITKAMLANADKIPNQRDSTYPVQQKHRDSLVGKSATTHTHVAGDFTMAHASRTAFGASQLGSLATADTEAADVQIVGTLSASVAQLWTRPKSVVNRDPTIPVDVEI